MAALPEGWVEAEIDVGEVTLHYYRRGSGAPLVLAHGMLDDGACWTRVAEALEADYDVIAYDARFHGLTREPPDAAWGGADDLVGLVDALGLDQPAVIGHSMGASTTAQAIAEHPDRFRCAVLEDPAWLGAPRDAASTEASRAAFKQMLEAGEEELVAFGRASSPGWHDSEFGPWARSKQRFRGADKLAEAMERVTSGRWQDTVDRFRVPVLLVCGGDVALGRIVSPDIASEAQQRCPTLEVVTFDEAGHNVRREAYDGYVDAVRKFLAGV